MSDVVHVITEYKSEVYNETTKVRTLLAYGNGSDGHTYINISISDGDKVVSSGAFPVDAIRNAIETLNRK